MPLECTVFQYHPITWLSVFNGRSHCLNVTLWSDWLVLFNLIGCYECHSSIWLVVMLVVTLQSDWLLWMSLFDLIGWYGRHSWYQENWVEYTRNVLNFTSGYYKSFVGCPWGKTVQPFYMNKQSTNCISLKKKKKLGLEVFKVIPCVHACTQVSTLL